MFEPQEELLLKRAFASYHRALAAALPCAEELEPINLSERLEKRIKRLLYHQKHFYYTWINTAAKRIACVFAAILLIAAVSTVSVEAWRETFVDFIIEIFEKGSRVFVREGNASLELSPITPRVPVYIPEGYILVADTSSSMDVSLFYEAEDNNAIHYTQLPRGIAQSVNTEGVAYRKIFVLNIYEGIVFQNKGSTFLIFNDGECMYSIIGTILEEQALRMAESIFVNEK